MVVIEAIKLCKSHSLCGRSEVILQEINLTVKRGSFIALTGSSGSGKTTLLHLLGCLDTPSSGKLYLDGDEVSQFSPKKRAYVRSRKIGFVFQNFHLLPDLTTVENVMLPQLYAGLSEMEAKKRAVSLLEMVSLDHRLCHRPHELSGGQKQRVAIARSLALNPPIILADEPTGNLDTENGDAVLDLFDFINKEQKTTIIVVTHEKKVAERAEKCLILRDGRITI